MSRATLRNAVRPFFIPILLAIGTSLAASWPATAQDQDCDETCSNEHWLCVQACHQQGGCGYGCDQTCYNMCDDYASYCGCFYGCPLVVQAGNGPWELTSPDDGVLFDMDSDGVPEWTGWTAAGSSLAFLTLDVNANGTIDDARELFGEWTRLPNGGSALNGFDALLQHDSNNDGTIDERDPVWESILLWTDSNHDGQSQSSELQPVSASDIRAIGTRFHELYRRDPSENMFRFESLLRRTSGARRPYYDIYFRSKTPLLSGRATP